MTANALIRAGHDVSALTEELGAEYALARYGLEPLPAQIFALSMTNQDSDKAAVFLHGLMCGLASVEEETP